MGKWQQLFIAIFLLSICIGVSAQSIRVSPEDTIYLDRDTAGLWSFKENLNRGDYYVVDPIECGEDTLLTAHFSAKGVKTGKWFEYQSTLCLGEVDTVTGEVISWQYSFDKQYLMFHTEYESNYIIQFVMYHAYSDQPQWELYYPPKAREMNEWVEELIWNEDGTLKERVVR